MKRLVLNEDDQFIYDHEIGPFLPNRIFDAHNHLMNRKFHDYQPDPDDTGSNEFFYDVGIKDLKNTWNTLFPDSTVSGLIMGTPVYNCDLIAENQFVAESMADENDRFSLMIDPEIPTEEIEKSIQDYKPAGLKPYYLHALVVDKQNANITDYLTYEQLALADQYKLAITLHVSKPRGMADPDNLNELSRLIVEFKNVQFILAHCGRCFIAPNMTDALDKLPVAENLWVDTSAVCDTGVFLELLSGYDRSRILFGTDLVTPTGFRGSYVRLGMSWHYITAGQLAGLDRIAFRATLAVYENLIAFFQAARFCGVSEEEIQNIFFYNASKLFQL